MSKNTQIRVVLLESGNPRLEVGGLLFEFGVFALQIRVVLLENGNPHLVVDWWPPFRARLFDLDDIVQPLQGLDLVLPLHVDGSWWYLAFC